MSYDTPQSSLLIEEQEKIGPSALSAEALLELEEMTAGVREDAPTLDLLVECLRTPEKSVIFEGHGSISMLEDARSYTVLRDAMGINNFPKPADFSGIKKIIDAYLQEVRDGVHRRDRSIINEAKKFCMVLGEGLLAKQMREVYDRKDRSEPKYVGRNAVL